MEVSKPSKHSYEAKLSQNVRVMVATQMRTAEYRAAETDFERVNILHNSEFSIPINYCCTAVGISSKTYYKYKKLILTGEDLPEKTPPNQLLKPKEEESILQMILEAQLQSQCMCGADVRNIASEIYKTRTGIQHVFDRFWFRDFLRRHADVIAKKKCASVDDDRGSLDRAEIENYIHEISEALIDITDLRLVLNMDETGFGKRPDYGKRRSCIFNIKCPIEPVWRSSTDNYHISWVSCISAGATHTKPLLITTRVKLDDAATKTFIPKFFDFFRTPKGYQTNASMLYWVTNILTPYVQSIRDEIDNQEHPVVLIMDGLGSHFYEKTNE